MLGRLSVLLLEEVEVTALFGNLVILVDNSVLVCEAVLFHLVLVDAYLTRSALMFDLTESRWLLLASQLLFILLPLALISKEGLDLSFICHIAVLLLHTEVAEIFNICIWYLLYYLLIHSLEVRGA